MGVGDFFLLLLLLTLISLCHNLYVCDSARNIVVEPKPYYHQPSSSFTFPPAAAAPLPALTLPPAPTNADQLAIPISKRDDGSVTYVVTIGLGTPTQNFNLMLDTGSATTWVNCKGGGGPIYVPSLSTTSTPCTFQFCNFNISYLDTGFSNGNTAIDKFTISNYQFPSIAFGCARNLDPKSAKTDGILALGRTNNDVVPSLLSQTAQTYHSTFCYCLPTAATSSGFLLFGSQATQRCQNTKPTRLVPVTDPAHSAMYFVNLIGITIGDERRLVLIPASSSSSGVMAAIDSGTEISRLPCDMYQGVKAEFKRWMGGNSNYKEAEKGEGVLDTCYEVAIGDLEVPKMVMHFEDGLNVNLDKGAVVWVNNQNGLVCLGFAAKKQEESGVTIIGNHQHKGFNLLYDNQHNTVAFGPGSC